MHDIFIKPVYLYKWSDGNDIQLVDDDITLIDSLNDYLNQFEHPGVNIHMLFM